MPSNIPWNVRGAILVAFLKKEKLRFVGHADEAALLSVRMDSVCGLLEAVLHGSQRYFTNSNCYIVGGTSVLDVRNFVQFVREVIQGDVEQYWGQNRALRSTRTSA